MTNVGVVNGGCKVPFFKETQNVNPQPKLDEKADVVEIKDKNTQKSKNHFWKNYWKISAIVAGAGAAISGGIVTLFGIAIGAKDKLEIARYSLRSGLINGGVLALGALIVAAIIQLCKSKE